MDYPTTCGKQRDKVFHGNTTVPIQKHGLDDSSIVEKLIMKPCSSLNNMVATRHKRLWSLYLNCIKWLSYIASQWSSELYQLIKV